MNLKFDYYHNLENPDLLLFNPDGRDLYPIIGTERLLTLRFNDLSELSFACYSTTTNSSGEVIQLDYYDWLQTRRLVFLEDVGWFVIKKVEEHDNGVVKYKSVSCESLQATFKDRGFYSDERVYYFYNPSDPTDANYNPDDEASIPSVVGQLYQQLGVQTDLTQGLDDPLVAYGDWTITYINADVKAASRNFKENTTYGYDFMVRDASEAFGAVFLFDFMYRTIHIMLPSEITEKANVLYSFSNFMKDVDIEEDAENIVTVLNCNGDNCDITGVNPSGTNYICDFSYYMDEVNHRWMSDDLIQAIKGWKYTVDENKSDYRSGVQNLRSQYAAKESLNSELQEISMIYTDLSAAVANKSIALSENPSVKPHGIVWAETVNTSAMSIDEDSDYYNSSFTDSSQITCYINPPVFDEISETWSFVGGGGITGSAEWCYNYVDGSNNQYHYFMDGDNKSYCKLEGKAIVDSSTHAVSYSVSGFKRYIDLDITNVWMQKYEQIKVQKENAIAFIDDDIAAIKAQLQFISDSCNIIKYFTYNVSSVYLKELYCYWIDGDYTNENISVLEDTTQAEALDLAQELMEAGEVELAKVCQPKLQFSLSSVDCTKLYEFRDQMSELELGKIITVEKEEGLWYYPALLEIEINLDTTDTFNLKFANALRLDDWGFTYGDLISDASATSRQVSANWQNMLQYAKDKPAITDLIRDPLSMTLRAAFANMTNQEFTIDDTGILGRKFTNDYHTSFLDEQMRIINNVILFTDDNWETVRTALGKVYYTDPDTGLPVSKYGLIAEAIIGELIMGETLKIHNSDNSVIIDGEGITIKNSNNQNVFRADPDGSLTLRGYATESALLAGLNEKNSVYRQTSAPTQKSEVNPTGYDLIAGDIWIDTDDDGKMYVWDGTQWNATLANANKTYKQDNEPNPSQLTLREGDLWIDNSNGNKLYRYSAQLGWQEVTDTRVSDIDDSIDNIQIIYYLARSLTPWPTAPSTWVTNYQTTEEVWTAVIPTPQKNHYYFRCTQTKRMDGDIETTFPELMDTDNTILAWCASADTTKIDGGTIYTGTIYASALNTQDIVTNLLTVKDSNNQTLFLADPSTGAVAIHGSTIVSGTLSASAIDTSSLTVGQMQVDATNPHSTSTKTVLFKADAQNEIVQIGNFTVGKTYSTYGTNVGYIASNGHNELYDTNYAGVYIGDDGISILGTGGTNTMVLDVASASFSFTGTISATSGRFYDGCIIGGTSTSYPFIIGASSNVTGSSVIYSGSNVFPGMGKIGVRANNNTYIGGDGLSYYYYNSSSGYEYSTGIRSGSLICYMNNTTYHRSIAMVGGSMYFSCNGSSYLSDTGTYGVIDYSVAYFETHPGYVHVSGQFNYADGTVLASDRNTKNTITPLADAYEVFFDKLKPVTYKYNNGKSGRLHSGFVAQDVYDAIMVANLTTKDVAAYVELDEGKGDITCGLRYEEFVALNTWQIQKLKQRVADLEEMIARMQNTK